MEFGRQQRRRLNCLEHPCQSSQTGFLFFPKCHLCEPDHKNSSLLSLAQDNFFASWIIIFFTWCGKGFRFLTLTRLLSALNVNSSDGCLWASLKPSTMPLLLLSCKPKTIFLLVRQQLERIDQAVTQLLRCCMRYTFASLALVSCWALSLRIGLHCCRLRVPLIRTKM